MATTLLDLAIKIGAEDEASGTINKLSTGAIAKGVAIGNAMSNAMSKVVDLAKSAATKVAGLVSDAAGAYGEYEQLVGGVDKLFGTASDKLQGYATSAYKTSGLSANKYMTQVTSFSASLISSLGGDTSKAADMADLAIRTMSDNVDTFGSDMSDVQNAFQGFSKQNYTMLDNLKLGYGGTKSEMERLIADANKLPAVYQEGADLSVDSFSDIVEAIARVQEAQGIAGTTANEASTTIQGSLRQMQGAFENWKVAIAGGELDIQEQTGLLVDSVLTYASNIVPRVIEIVGSLGSALPGAIAELGPTIKSGVVDLFKSFVAPAMTDGSSEAVLAATGEFSQLYDKVSYTVGTVQWVLEGIWDGFVSGVSDVLGPSVSDVDGMLQGLNDFLTDIKEPVSDLAWAVGSLLAEAFSALHDGASWLWEQFEPLVGPVLEVVSGLISEAARVVHDLAHQAGEVLGPIIEEKVVPALGHFLDAIEPWIEPLGNVAEIFGNILIAAIGLFLGIVATLVEGVSGLLDWFMDLDEALQDLPQAFEDAFRAIGEWFSDLAEDISQFFEDTIQGVKDWASDTVENARQAASDFVTNVENFFKELPGKIKAKLDEAINKVKTWASDMATKAKNAGSDFLNNVKDKVGELPSKMKEKLDSAITKVKNFATDFKAKAKEAAGGFLTNLVNGLASIPSQMLQIGKNIVVGVWNGIASLGRWFADQVSGFFGGIVNSAKSALGIASPAKKMMPVGSDSVKGVEVGMEQEEPSLLSTIDNVMGSAVDAAQEGAAKFRAELGGLTDVDKLGVSLDASVALNAGGSVGSMATRQAGASVSQTGSGITVTVTIESVTLSDPSQAGDLVDEIDRAIKQKLTLQQRAMGVA